MKTFISLIAVSLTAGIILLVTANLLEQSDNNDGNTLYVYNWGEYIDPELLEKFYEETGIRVVYETFDSNEAMMVKVNQGGTPYDVIFPSEYTVEKMIKDELIIPLDYSRLPNAKNIDTDISARMPEEITDYSVPYFFGTVGILYNEETLPELDFSTWDTLWDESLENEILMVDGAREVLGMSLNSMGESLNTTEDKKLEAATAKLIQLSPNIRGIVGDEIASMMTENEAQVAVVWSGMAQDIMWENEELNYTVPKEGSNLWFDAMVIPKNSKNTDGAYQFINFLLDSETAAVNAEWVGYATPNTAALELLDEEVREDTRFYPEDDQLEALEMYRDLGPEMISRYNELFLQFKMSLD